MNFEIHFRRTKHIVLQTEHNYDNYDGKSVGIFLCQIICLSISTQIYIFTLSFCCELYAYMLDYVDTDALGQSYQCEQIYKSVSRKHFNYITLFFQRVSMLQIYNLLILIETEVTTE